VESNNISKKISYDKAGNMIVDDIGYVYSYNSLNQLKSVTDSNNQLLSSYKYYADGLLSTKEGKDNIELNFYYDNGHIDGVSSTDKSSPGRLLSYSATNFMLNPAGSIIASFDGTGFNSYLTAGNSTIGMFDESGVLTNSYSYTGYGTIMNEDGVSSQSKSFLWDGQYLDIKTNLVYENARFMSPRLNRFINADTYNVANLYNFGNGDPINNTDPSGHMVGLDDFIGLIVSEMVEAAMTEGVATSAATAAEEEAASSAAAASEDAAAGKMVNRNTKSAGAEAAANTSAAEMSTQTDIFTATVPNFAEKMTNTSVLRAEGSDMIINSEALEAARIDPRSYDDIVEFVGKYLGDDAQFIHDYATDTRAVMAPNGNRGLVNPDVSIFHPSLHGLMNAERASLAAKINLRNLRVVNRRTLQSLEHYREIILLRNRNVLGRPDWTL
jgi:RHS repeat-associated protein